MRTRHMLLIALLIAAIVVAGLPFASAPRTVNAAPAGCSDSKFLTDIGKDFTAVGDFLKQIDSSDPTHLIATQIVLNTLRQKYEDTSTTDDCLNTQISVMAFIANVNDLITLKLAAVVDSKNADSYTKDLTDQETRIQKWLKIVTDSIGSEATPAAK